MTDNIINMPTPRHVLVERLRAAHERTIKGRQEWIEGTADEAAILAEARDGFARGGPGDTAFGVWLVENELDHWGHGDRAAMIHLGRLTRDDLLFVLDTVANDRWKPDTIWRMIQQKRFEYTARNFNRSGSDHPNLTPDSTLEAEVTVFPSPQPPAAALASGLAAKTESGPAKLKKQHSFHDLPRGAELAAVFLSKEAPHRIGPVLKGRHGKEIWELMLQCYDAGFLRDSKYAPGGTPNLSLMLLFPRTPVPYAKRYMVTDQKDRETIRERIIPAAMAYRDELLAAPDSLEQIVQKHERVNREQAAIKAREQRLETARQKLSPTEPEVIIYGHHFWPIIDIADPDQRYDYATLTAAAWFFADALALARGNKEDNSPRSCGMNIRFLVKRFSLFNKTSDPHDPSRARWMKVFHLVHEMTRLLEKHGHEGATGNRMPFLPSED